jgi:hypothetical protein
MLEMARLERAEEPPSESRPSAHWGARQSIVLLGIVILVGALVPGILLLRGRPVRPMLDVDPDAIRRESQELAPIQAWRVWRSLRAGGLDRRRLITDVKYNEAILRWWSAMAVVLVVAGIGVILIVAPLVRKRRPAWGDYSRST